MRNHWDTIVVGAGLGGLTAAVKLANAGRRVLVLERNPHPGGTAFVYHRKGFSFPMGPLGFSHPGIIRSILKDLEVGDDLALRRVHYRIRAFDCDLPLSLPPDEMVKELSERFPSDAQAVKRFFQEVSARQASPYQGESGADVLAIPDVYRSSASEYLRQRIRNEKLRRILGSIGTREPYSGLPLLAAMWNLMTEEGIWYPVSGIRVFSERLVKVLARQSNVEKASESSGNIRLATEVVNIRVESGKVIGVTLRDGSKIDSPSVISNADYKSTVLKLLDRREIPPLWYQAVSRARQTGSVLQVCLGVDKSKADLSSFREASRLIYRNPNAEPTGGVDWNAREVDPEVLTKEELEISLWSKEDPSLAPEGKAVVIIRTEAQYSHFRRYRLGSRERAAGYEAYKSRLGCALAEEVETLIPRLRDSIQMMDVATPLTFEDQGGRSEGAVAGWSWDYEDSQDEKPRELIRTPIKGLFMAGYQAFSALLLGGIPTAMESGKRAAQAVLDGVDPTFSL